MNDKQIVVSSYSDLSKLSPKTKSVHLRKFVSKNLIKIILDRCPNLERLTFSRYSYRRFKSAKLKNIEIKISEKSAGRPNLVECIQ